MAYHLFLWNFSISISPFILNCIYLYYTDLYCTVPICTILTFTVLYCTVLYCTVLYWPVAEPGLPHHVEAARPALPPVVIPAVSHQLIYESKLNILTQFYVITSQLRGCPVLSLVVVIKLRHLIARDIFP